jgi:hypothetical protein
MMEDKNGLWAVLWHIAHGMEALPSAIDERLRALLDHGIARLLVAATFGRINVDEGMLRDGSIS